MPGLPGDQAERQFIGNAENRTKFDTLRATHWGKKSNGKPITPTHWHRLSLAERAKAHGKDEEVRYRRLYSKLCSFSHAGLINMSAAAMVRAFFMGHVFAHSIFLRASQVVADHLKCFAADPKLKESLDEYSRAEAAKLADLARKHAEDDPMTGSTINEEAKPATEKG
jgi:hypothetical protein